jgi:hypothetical protein
MAKANPSVNAFCLNEPSDRFISLVSFDNGVLAFECVFNSFTSDTVYSSDDFLLRCLFSHFDLQLVLQRLDITIAFIIKQIHANTF